eukprot:jgi/Bigna1/71839/fgenesh1_pg.17_\
MWRKLMLLLLLLSWQQHSVIGVVIISIRTKTAVFEKVLASNRLLTDQPAIDPLESAAVRVTLVVEREVDDSKSSRFAFLDAESGDLGCWVTEKRKKKKKKRPKGSNSSSRRRRKRITNKQSHQEKHSDVRRTNRFSIEILDVFAFRFFSLFSSLKAAYRGSIK